MQKESFSRYTLDNMRPHLQNVAEIGPIVTSNPDLLSCHTLMHIIPLATTSQPVLAAKHQMHKNTTTKQADNLVRQNNTMTCPVARSFGFQIDIGADLCGC